MGRPFLSQYATVADFRAAFSEWNNAKVSKIDAILARMSEAYEEEGIEGDFADARRYYLNDASEEEINSDYAKWCPNA